MPKSKRSADKEQAWRLAIAKQQQSGLAIKAFCQQQDLSIPSFYFWRREIRKRDALSSDKQGLSPADDVGRLVPVSVVKPIGNELDIDPDLASDSLQIITPNGFTLRVDQAVLPQRLAALIDVLTRCQASGGRSC